MRVSDLVVGSGALVGHKIKIKITTRIEKWFDPIRAHLLTQLCDSESSGELAYMH
jgi:hypothetical protein